jgi:DNA-directed RNA polymerase specialized sigma24 family protein
MELRRKAGTYSLNAMEEANIKVKPAHEKESEWHVQIDVSHLDDERVFTVDAVYDEVIEEIKTLPEPYRQVLMDREFDKLKYEEIAEKRNIKINTVRSRIHVAKKLVKNRWLEKRRQENVKGDIRIGTLTVEISQEGSSASEPNTSPSIITDAISQAN